ncbi:MAG: GntR family transcriptional regulator [Gammaproteobacteria bacterium]|nr:GntR family transcriptional regulator [Gammaproteobacteria bacterium]
MSRQSENQAERFDRIYKEIRERICLLDYQPGTLLNEGLLAEEFAVSRTPVRNVLLRLNYEGLVETRNGVGTIVTDLDFKMFKDIYELRMRLAEMAGDLSPLEPSSKVVEALDDLRFRTERLGEASLDQRGYANICNELHELLLDQIGNHALRETTDLLYYRAARIWLTFLHKLDWADEVGNLQHEISEIQRALKIGDMHGVGNARRQFLYLTLTRISQFLTEV